MTTKKTKYPKDLSGIRFGRLVVIRLHTIKNAGKRGSRSYWLCKCDCGNKKSIERCSLVTGHTKSCGCYELESKKTRFLTHGMSKTRLWNIWINMIDRCKRETSSDYCYYGGRGISVCDEWEDFKTFADWSLNNGYSGKLTIDRINNDEGYSPNNCRWVSRKKQTRNRSITRTAMYNGKEMPVAEIAEKEGIGYQAAYDKYIRKRTLGQPQRQTWIPL